MSQSADVGFLRNAKNPFRRNFTWRSEPGPISWQKLLCPYQDLESVHTGLQNYCFAPLFRTLVHRVSFASQTESSDGCPPFVTRVKTCFPVCLQSDLRGRVKVWMTHSSNFSNSSRSRIYLLFEFNPHRREISSDRALNTFTQFECIF